MASLRTLAVVAVVGGVLASPTTCWPADHLAVDFGNGTVQSDFDTFASSSGSDVQRIFATPLGHSGTVVVRVQSPSLSWRVRSQSVSGEHMDLDPLLHDFVFCWSSSVLHLKLQGLAAGAYVFSSYHHDTPYSDHGALDVQVTDPLGTRDVASNLVQSWGPEPSTLARADFEFSANGNDAITIVYAVTQGTGNAAILNGFSVANQAVAVESATWGSVKHLFHDGD